LESESRRQKVQPQALACVVGYRLTCYSRDGNAEVVYNFIELK
jgi:hypothetical protein